MGFAKIPRMDKEKEAKRIRWIEELLNAKVRAIDGKAYDKVFDYMVQLFTFFEGAEPKRAIEEKERINKLIDEMYDDLESGKLNPRSIEMKRRNRALDRAISSYLNKWFNFSATTKGFDLVEEEIEEDIDE